MTSLREHLDEFKGNFRHQVIRSSYSEKHIVKRLLSNTDELKKEADAKLLAEKSEKERSSLSQRQKQRERQREKKRKEMEWRKREVRFE